MTSADFSHRHPVASPFQARSEISLGKNVGLHRTTARYTPRLFDRESFAVFRQLALIGSASYLISVRRLTVSFHASFTRSLAVPHLRFPSVPTVGFREDFHLRVIIHARHTKRPPARINPQWGPLIKPGNTYFLAFAISSAVPA